MRHRVNHERRNPLAISILTPACAKVRIFESRGIRIILPSNVSPINAIGRGHGLSIKARSCIHHQRGRAKYKFIPVIHWGLGKY